MRFNTLSVFAVAFGIASVGAAGVSAQNVTLLVGAYVPASSFKELGIAGQTMESKREATLGLGANLDLGLLRLSAAYASGATLSQDSGGVTGQENIGDGSVLAIAADLVFRPLPRLIIIQPYIFGGAGLKHQSYSFDTGATTSGFRDGSGLTGHVGVGLDIALGRLGLVAEFSDFISQDADDDWKTHDAFAMVGLKFRLF